MSENAILAAVREHLASQGTITQYVGGRIFGEHRDQWAKLPAITYSEMGHEQPSHLGGTTPLARSRVQVDCWSKAQPEADAIAESVRDTMQFFKGTIGDVVVRLSTLKNRTSGWMAAQDGSDNGAYRASLTFEIWHKTAQPANV